MSVYLTPHKALRTGHSVWSDTRHPQVPTHGLKRGLTCDVAVVGAGVSGAFMAEKLSRVFDQVVVLDRRAPALGSTHASTALLQYEIDTPLTELAEKIGYQRAARAWRLSKRMTAALMQLVREQRVPCDLAERSSLYLAGDTMGWRAMQKEARARNRAGLACEFLPGAAVRARYAIDRTGAIVSTGAAVADPVALTRGLLRRARARGTRIFAPCEVKGVLANARGVVLDAGGQFIEAKAVVFCTGYEAVHGLPKAGTQITSSWAAATVPHTPYPPWLDQMLVWEAASPYLYMRTDRQGRLIVGGEDADLDSPVYRRGTLGQKAERLATKTHRLLPALKPRWTHIWAGAFGESADGLPIIDAIPGMPHCFTVMGFGGNGTIYSFLAAHLMPGLIKGSPLRDAELFRFR